MTRESRHLSFSTVLRWTDKQCLAYLENVRWPNGPICPKCGVPDPYHITRKTKSKNKVQSLYKCRGCRRQFTATIGTLFEASKIPLRKWFAAIYPICAFKRGISVHQAQIQARVTYKTAWYMCYRIREIIYSNTHLVPEGTVASIAQKKQPRQHARLKIKSSFGQTLAMLAPSYGRSHSDESGISNHSDHLLDC